MKRVLGVVGFLFVLVFSFGIVSAYAEPPVFIKWDDGCPAANSCGSVIPDARINPERYVVASCSGDDCCCWCNTGYSPSGGKCYPNSGSGSDGGSVSSDHSDDVDNVPLIIGAGIYTGHMAEDEESGYYKIDLIGPSKLTFKFDVSSGIDRNYVGFDGVWIIAADTATIEKRLGNMYTGSSSRLIDDYTTKTGGIRYIRLMSRHELLDYTMDLDITCVEGALSDDGLKKCASEEWVELDENVTSAGETVDEALLIEEGIYTGHISEDEEFDFYKIDLIGPSKLTFFFDVSSGIDRNYVGFQGVWIIAEDTATTEERFSNMYTGSSSRLTDDHTTKTGGVRYIKLQARHSLLDYDMNLEITCLEGNFSDDGFMKCIGGEWVSVGDDDKSGEIIPLECDGDGDGSCPGCLVADKCYTIGYRKAGEYCSDDLDFVSQVAADESCVNNFECNSNVCVSGECISAGFVEQILSWFRGLFS